jgi:hypothetical protein
MLAIPGKFPRGAFGLARGHRVQLIDTAHHWQELEPLLTDTQLEAINAPAEARMRRQTRLAWTAAAVIALVLALVGHDRDRRQDDEAAVAVASADQPAGAVGPRQAPSAAGAPPDATLAPLPLEQRRADLAEAIGALPHVLGASWTTGSTLRVEVDNDAFDPKDRLCPLLEADADLRASRIQLQAPPGSTRPVRFLQCRAY